MEKWAKHPMENGHPTAFSLTLKVLEAQFNDQMLRF
jgi:hypothetical protein